MLAVGRSRDQPLFLSGYHLCIIKSSIVIGIHFGKCLGRDIGKYRLHLVNGHQSVTIAIDDVCGGGTDALQAGGREQGAAE